MGTSTLAGRPAELTEAKVAFSGLDDWCASFRINDEITGPVSDLDQLDIVVGTGIGTVTATNAKRVINHHAAVYDTLADGTGRTFDQADRIGTMHTGIGDLYVAMDRPMADETRVVVMGCGASPNTIIAARASRGIYHHGLGPIDDPLVGEKIK